MQAIREQKMRSEMRAKDGPRNEMTSSILGPA